MKNLNILIILIILVGLVGGGFLVSKMKKVSCDKLEEQIFTLLEQANYCDADSDCIVEGGGGCPFGCYHLFNKNADLTKIDEGMQKFSDCFYCVYECIEAPTAEEIKCINHKCDDTLYLKKWGL